MTKLVTNLQVNKLVSQGRQGPPGPAGAGVGVKVGQYYIRGTFSNTLTNPIVLLSSAAYPFTVDGLKGLKVSSGTVTLDIKINGVAVTGLDSLAVTSTPQDVLATALNEVAEGDRVTLELSDASSPTDLEFTMEAHA